MGLRYKMYDCGCVTTRPKESRYYASRWRVYISEHYVILKCLDCGRTHHYLLKNQNIQIMGWDRSTLDADMILGGERDGAIIQEDNSQQEEIKR